MKVRSLIVENIMLPIGDIISSQSVAPCFRFLMKSQYWTREQINNYQNKKLQLLVNHAYNTVPYYNDLFNKYKLKPEDIKTKYDLNKIPITTKATIKKEGIERFTSTSFPKKEIINASSSGSTGEPLFYLNTKKAYSMNIASSLRGWYWTGYRLGDKFVKLSQNVRDLKLKKIQDKITNNLYLASDPLTDSNFEFILKKIEEYKPNIIRCYPDPLLFLARYKTTRNIYKHKPHAIATTGNTLFAETRKEIEEAFGCKIFDAYNCEGNSVVFECPTHTCYHSTEEYGISEVIDEEGNNITNGVGRLISTDLHNFAHPFIRYDTQDLIEIDNTPCKCEREHLKILRILGRDNDVITSKTGRKFIVHNFTGFFQIDSKELNRSVEQFQIRKTKNEKIKFLLVVNNRYNNNAKSFIQNYWEKQFEQSVDIELVNKIPLTKSGKRRFIINE